MSSLEDDFAMPCILSGKFYMTVSQRYNKLDSTACTGQKADTRGKRGPPGWPCLLTSFMIWKKNNSFHTE